MESQEFDLKGREFIPLDKLLKLLNLAESGGEAHAIINEGNIRVNNIPELQKRKKLRPGDTIQFAKHTILIK